MNNYSKEEREGEDKAAVRQLKTLEDMLHNRIAKKKVETDKYHEIAETDRIRTEIDRDIAMGAIRESLSEDA